MYRTNQAAGGSANQVIEQVPGTGFISCLGLYDPAWRLVKLETKSAAKSKGRGGTGQPRPIQEEISAALHRAEDRRSIRTGRREVQAAAVRFMSPRWRHSEQLSHQEHATQSISRRARMPKRKLSSQSRLSDVEFEACKEEETAGGSQSGKPAKRHVHNPQSRSQGGTTAGIAIPLQDN
jgi:hypothetical protein